MPRPAPLPRRPLRGLITALLLSGIGGNAIAADPPRRVGDWSVSASKDGKGCFLTRAYDRPGGTTLLLGIDVDGSNHLTVLNDNWSIKPRERLSLTFRLTAGGYPDHFAVGLASDGKRGFAASFEPSFPRYFAQSSALLIFRGDVPVERLTLAGSGAAVAELRACVDRVRAAPPAAMAADRDGIDAVPKDPFSNRKENKKK